MFGDLSCWFAFGLWKTDVRLITLGVTGVAASVLMLAPAEHANAGRIQTVDAAECRA